MNYLGKIKTMSQSDKLRIEFLTNLALSEFPQKQYFTEFKDPQVLYNAIFEAIGHSILFEPTFEDNPFGLISAWALLVHNNFYIDFKSKTTISPNVKDALDYFSEHGFTHI